MHSREKARLYHELGQLLRAGVQFPRAVDKLISLTRGRTAAALQECAQALKNGATAAEALAAPRAFAGLDSAIFAASDKSGHLEHGLALAGQYHETIAAAYSRVMVKAAYPLFIIHFAILTFAVPKFVTEGSGAFFAMLIGSYAALWGGILALWLFWRGVLSLAQRQVAFDRLLLRIPILGGLRTQFALSRFCLAYDMQLEAGINVFSALETSSAAAGGAAYAAAALRAAQAVRDGEPLSAALAGTGLFPEPLIRVFDIGETTGQLDVELQRAAVAYRDSAVKRIEFLVEWTPRVALIFAAVFVGYRIFNYYAGYMNSMRGFGL